MSDPAIETPGEARNARPVLITGGSGFVGSNLADRLLSDGNSVLIFDNLSREGVAGNFRWLKEKHGNAVTLIEGDIRDSRSVAQAVKQASAVFHLAAQVAVTTSLTEPEDDFAINTVGTLNVLNAIRLLPKKIPLVFTSTNKVYGKLGSLAFEKEEQRYAPSDAKIRQHGISESQPLEFFSPYGCSKGAADQYVLDYARTYDIPAVVFRMSCIYGPRQFGTEDQGWVAHFLIQAQKGLPITIYGDGRQVRDILYVGDLVEALLLARAKATKLSGQAFNIGGGPERTVSLLELLDLIGELENSEVQTSFNDWRTGDQSYYVSDVSKFTAATGWKPRVEIRDGIQRLRRWLKQEVVPSELAVETV
ncbi:MAG TPA: SDR family NAD(P)-dependent oxidoreductase [Chthoniobacterales bacterium]|jgi:CDP-paratose 2-epimerase